MCLRLSPRLSAPVYTYLRPIYAYLRTYLQVSEVQKAGLSRWGGVAVRQSPSAGAFGAQEHHRQAPRPTSAFGGRLRRAPSARPRPGACTK